MRRGRWQGTAWEGTGRGEELHRGLRRGLGSGRKRGLAKGAKARRNGEREGGRRVWESSGSLRHEAREGQG